MKEEEIEFLDKEIQRLEDISRKTHYRLIAFKKIRERLHGVARKNRTTGKMVQLSFFGT